MKIITTTMKTCFLELSFVLKRKMQNSWSFAAMLCGLLCFATMAHAQVPGAPTGFEAHPTSNSGTPPINLDWDPTPGATSYIVYRSTSAKNETQYATSTTNSYLDSNVVKGPPTVYYYEIAAVNASGTGPKSVESATPTPLPTSSGNGMQAGISIGGGAYQWNCEYALLDNFDWFIKLNGWFPKNLGSSGAISPGNRVVDMAYASQGTMSFLNVNVPTSGLYNIDWRYAFASGLFGGVTNREMSLIVNGVDLTDHQRFPITGSFNAYQHSVLQAQLNAGVNSIVMAAVTDHGISRVDTLTVSPASGSVPAGPTDLKAVPDNGQVHLSWSGVSGATSYNIYRGTKSDGESLTPVATVSSGTTTYTNIGLSNGKLYFYNVAAINSFGIGPDSNEVSVTSGGVTSGGVTSGGGGLSNNLALNRPATASSMQSSTSGALKAVDGNLSTRWSSVFSDPQWIYVDLGSTHSITGITLNWETAYGKAYSIQVSNDAVSWTTIYSTTTGIGGTENLALSGSGRYVRMYGTKRGTGWGYSLWEFQVFGN
jgi:hypothetical protein